jgi:hypothetical protein
MPLKSWETALKPEIDICAQLILGKKAACRTRKTAKNLIGIATPSRLAGRGLEGSKDLEKT